MKNDTIKKHSVFFLAKVYKEYNELKSLERQQTRLERKRALKDCNQVQVKQTCHSDAPTLDAEIIPPTPTKTQSKEIAFTTAADVERAIESVHGESDAPIISLDQETDVPTVHSRYLIFATDARAS